MMQNYADILFIDAVRALQEKDGSAEKFDRFYPSRTKDALDADDRNFIAERESFYIASVSSTGWPYVQHRGGPKGFLKVLSDNQLGFIDYPGNRQFITMGHAAQDDRVALFFMDYERRARMKLLGHLKMQPADEADAELCQRLAVEGQPKAERVATIDVVALDWNCPKYIPQLFGREKVKDLLVSQINQLTQENEALMTKLQALQNP